MTFQGCITSLLDVLLEGVGSEVVTPPSNNHMINVARSSVLIPLHDLNFMVSDGYVSVNTVLLQLFFSFVSSKVWLIWQKYSSKKCKSYLWQYLQLFLHSSLIQRSKLTSTLCLQTHVLISCLVMYGVAELLSMKLSTVPHLINRYCEQIGN